MVCESRTIARLLQQGLDHDQILERVVAGNLLQKRSLQYTKKVCGAILNRLGRVDEAILNMVCGAERQVAIQALLALNLVRSRLLFDFFVLGLADEFRLGHEKLENTVWNRFIEGCISRDPSVHEWSNATLETMRKVVFRMLVESGYMESTRTRKLQEVFIDPEVIDYLKSNRLERILRAMQVSYV